MLDHASQINRHPQEAMKRAIQRALGTLKLDILAEIHNLNVGWILFCFRLNSVLIVFSDLFFSTSNFVPFQVAGISWRLTVMALHIVIFQLKAFLLQ